MAKFFTITSATALLLALTALSSCSDDNADITVTLPKNINNFISLYYPGTAVSATSLDNGIYTVDLRDSASLSFDFSGEWISVNGRGSTLPEIFLYDKMPEKLYQYLTSTSNLSSVYVAARNSKTYSLTLTDSEISYDIASGNVSYITD